MTNNFFIKENYACNPTPRYVEEHYFSDFITSQPHIYPLAGYLAERFSCSHIIDVGCGVSRKLLALGKYILIGIDYGTTIKKLRKFYPYATFMEWDLEEGGIMPVPESILSDSVVICADVIEHLKDPTNLLKNLKHFSKYSPAVLISTPERDVLLGSEHIGPPHNLHHVREWNILEFEKLLTSFELNIGFIGLTVTNDYYFEKGTILTILRKNICQVQEAPKDFRVIAIMNSYNDEDIILSSIDYYTKLGIEVYLIDGGSTDSTITLAEKFRGSGLIGIEQISNFDQLDTSLRQKICTICDKLKPNWVILCNVDEIFLSPWRDANLKKDIFMVDEEGFTAIDSTRLIFHPIDDSFSSGDFISHFKHFEFNKISSYSQEIKIFKNSITNAVKDFLSKNFNNFKIYPFKFLLKSYPIRSQIQAIRKISNREIDLAETTKPYVEDDIARFRFIKPISELVLYDEKFNLEYLTERISGIGVRSINDGITIGKKILNNAIKDVEILQNINLQHQKTEKELLSQLEKLKTEPEN